MSDVTFIQRKSSNSEIHNGYSTQIVTCKWHWQQLGFNEFDPLRDLCCLKFNLRIPSNLRFFYEDQWIEFLTLFCGISIKASFLFLWKFNSVMQRSLVPLSLHICYSIKGKNVETFEWKFRKFDDQNGNHLNGLITDSCGRLKLIFITWTALDRLRILDMFISSLLK